MEKHRSIHGGMLVGEILKENGVEYAFGIHGTHVWPYERGFYEFGIKRVHMRHEQAAVYAADAYARITRRPSICYATSGPGMTNTISGIAQAWWARSPVIALFGQHDRNLNGKGTLQEAYAEEMCKTITKWVVVNEKMSLISSYLRKALFDCMSYPPGPIAIANTLKALLIRPRKSDYIEHVPEEKKETKITGADFAHIEECTRLIACAERPVILAGNGAYWANAGSELRDLAELIACPFNLRRSARGIISEDHSLCINSGYRINFWKDADLLIIIGLDLNYLEAYGASPPYPKAKRIIINESEPEAKTSGSEDLCIIGNPKTILKQVLECAKSTKNLNSEKRKDWIAWLRRCQEDYQRWVRLNIADFRFLEPVHGFILGAQIADFLDSDATIILDSFTGSNYLTDHIIAKFPGQVLDTGPWGNIGHGIGMGIGAQLARPGKQVLVMMGDGGMGIGGMDIETAVRWKLPVVYVVYNDSDWVNGLRDAVFKDQVYEWGMMPDIRYDLMFEIIGCHAEFVTKPEEIRPALERAFNSGKTAVVNIIVEPKLLHRLIGTPFMRGIIKKLADKKKVVPEMWDLLEKGLTKEVIDKLRGLGYPFLRSRETLERTK
ncbi:MAG: thiamine pyrophosphate-binding protein [Syntrophales bacterium]